jgi:hypothetical protein
MRRAAVALAAAAAVLGAVPAEAAAPTRLMVTAREFSLVSSRQALPAGRAIIQLVNGGEDDHDLAMRRLGPRGKPAGTTIRFLVTAPGQISQRTVKLTRGRWQLWCSLNGHAGAGMRASLRVR